MHSSEEVHRLTETIYRNLSEQFNPAVRQILTCAKVYHKALVAASTAARGYIEALGRLGHNCKNSGQGGTEEIGEAVFRIAEVQKEIQLKFEDCNKAFFAEVVLPLEQKLDNDFKNAVAEQKKYQGGHKSYQGPYAKALESLRKFQKKYSKNQSLAFEDEKEIPLKRTLNRCKEKLDEFRLQGLKLALLEERKCYCFVLSRLCAVSSVQLYYHDRGMDLLSGELGPWKLLYSQPNILPRSADPLLHILDLNSAGSYAVYMPESAGHSPHHHSSRSSSEGQRSGPPSEYALPGTPTSSGDTVARTLALSMSQPPPGPAPGPPSGLTVRAVYSHMGEQDCQLTFSVGDAINLMGEEADGWQFGYSARTGQYGWFPLSFTDLMETQQQLQTQTPMRYHKRAKSYSDLNGDARSLSEFSAWSHEQHVPGSAYRPRSTHDSSLVTAPSLPQIYIVNHQQQQEHHHRQNSGGGGGAPPTPPPPLPPPPPLSASTFASVTLKKTKTNDRSAPKIK